MNDALLFRKYGPAGLDAQYNNRAAVPEHVELFEKWVEDSIRLLERFEHRLNVAYGSSETEKLDIIMPLGDGLHPINIFFHGGYWMSRSKDDLTFAARALVESGAVAVIVDYALMPHVRLDEIVRQCRASVAWTRANAAAFNADPDRIFVSGHSAGGHLTAMIMVTDWLAFSGAPMDTVKGGCALSGVFDLEPVRLCYIQQTLGLSKDEARRNSPIHKCPSTSAPLIAAVGSDESDEFHRQSQTLYSVWNAANRDCQLMVLPNINHFTIVGEFAEPTSSLAASVAGQMGLGG